MPRQSNTAEATAIETTPVHNTPETPECLKALLLQAIARAESGLEKWAGGNTQFEATRFMLGGRLEALRAAVQALEGDPEPIKNL